MNNMCDMLPLNPTWIIDLPELVVEEYFNKNHIRFGLAMLAGLQETAGRGIGSTTRCDSLTM